MVLFFLKGEEEGKKIVLTFVAVPSTVPLRVHALIKAILQLQLDAFSALNFLESKHGSDTVGEGEKQSHEVFHPHVGDLGIM